MRNLGIDVSKYQSVIDYGKLLSHEPPVEFVYIRKAVGRDYTDPYFLANFNGLDAALYPIPRRVLRGVYFVVRMDQDARSQVDNFMSGFHGGYGELPLALDLERDDNMPNSIISAVSKEVADRIADRTGKNPIMYSRAGWINQYLAGVTWLNNYDWWLASYLSSGAEHPGPPVLPKGLNAERVVIHQTSSHGPGPEYGVGSLNIDLDRWISSTPLHEYCAQPGSIPNNPEPNEGVQIMGWASNPIGCEVNARGDVQRVVDGGASFIVALAGGVTSTNNRNYEWQNPEFAPLVQAAYDAGVPCFARWKPIPAIYGRTEESVISEQLPFLLHQLENKTLAGVIIDGMMYEGSEGEKPASNNVLSVLDKFKAGIEAWAGANNKTWMVFVRINNSYIEDNAPTVMPWIKDELVFLADPRYRLKAQNNLQVAIPAATTTTVSGIRAHLTALPEGWNNPLVPTGSDLFAWGIGNFAFNGVSSKPYWYLFNGTDEAWKIFVEEEAPHATDPTPPPVEPDPVDPPPVEEPNDPPTVGPDYAKIGKLVFDLYQELHR